MAITNYSSVPEEEGLAIPGDEPKSSGGDDTVHYWQEPLVPRGPEVPGVPEVMEGSPLGLTYDEPKGPEAMEESPLGLPYDEPKGPDFPGSVFYWQEPVAPTYSSLRELPLLEGETIEEQFVPDEGLVSDTPWNGQVLVLTNQRIISFVENDGHNETLLAPIGEMKAVSVMANTRGVRDLVQGLGLVLIGILAYFILGYILDRVTVALALGAAIIFVGVLFVIKYLFWEEEGTIIFRGGSWDLSFPYKNNRASADVYKLVNRFFQLKL